MLKETCSSRTVEYMKDSMPSSEVITAFNLSGEPVLLRGGQGAGYRVGDAVLKPAGDALETIWIAEINDMLVSDQFRVPKPLKARDGSWIYNGWTASAFLSGEHREGAYAEAKELCCAFHQAFRSVQKPSWFDKKTDVFALADKAAWGEIPLPDYEPANDRLKKLVGLLRENTLENQLIHGDWGLNQILFHPSLPPAVLDLTPYFRPADYPIADMLISGIINHGNDLSILQLGNDVKEFEQLALRALLFRTCTYVGFQVHPENDDNWQPMIEKHLELADSVITKLAL